MRYRITSGSFRSSFEIISSFSFDSNPNLPVSAAFSMSFLFKELNVEDDADADADELTPLTVSTKKNRVV